MECVPNMTPVTSLLFCIYSSDIVGNNEHICKTDENTTQEKYI